MCALFSGINKVFILCIVLPHFDAFDAVCVGHMFAVKCPLEDTACGRPYFSSLFGCRTSLIITIFLTTQFLLLAQKFSAQKFSKEKA